MLKIMFEPGIILDEFVVLTKWVFVKVAVSSLFPSLVIVRTALLLKFSTIVKVISLTVRIGLSFTSNVNVNKSKSSSVALKLNIPVYVSLNALSGTVKVTKTEYCHYCIQ